MNNGTIRCAVYTRKSTDEGLDQEFNSLDAQRESAEAFIASQRSEGWECLPTRYDDGGFTGGNIDRPGLTKLMADIEAGRVDCVVVYKVDRLSRSLLDFAKLMEVFDKHNISFVSVTQQFNTNTSLGRLMLNVLLSFAQFEREIISERTRDKMAAARKKGKYVGGAPVLGYDIDREKSRLVVNESEAARVRQIFALYAECGSLLDTADELERREWTSKRWTTKTGKRRGGRTFNKNSLHGLLTNVAYVGQVKYQNETYDGRHEAIVDAELFERVQNLLRQNAKTHKQRIKNRYGALLRGLLRCKPCGCAMTPAASKKGASRYRYYVCTRAQKRGWGKCPSKSIPAVEIEQFVVDQIREIGQDPGLVAATLAELRTQAKERAKALERERRGLVRQRERDDGDLRHASRERDVNRSAELLERIETAEEKITKIDVELANLADDDVTEIDVATALTDFDSLWESLTPPERVRVIELLIEAVAYDGEAGSVSVTFKPSGFRCLNDEFPREEAA